MNLLKRIFSIGSKKNKKQRPPIVHDVPLPEQPWAEIRQVVDEEHEAAASRLLRSSSARYVESSELNYTNLPPLPHPINRVIQTPASSTISLDSASLTQKGTYNVTVYGRKKHPSTDFGDTHRELEERADKAAHQKIKRTSLHPVEDSRVIRLRSDPSVASLIDLYDDHGKLSADAFSNSPPKTPSNRREEGRAQVRRNGSTLRQLLGASSMNSREGNDSGSGEGDISWAERFLAETETTSSRSSLILQTPIAFSNVQLPEPDISLVTDGSFANSTIDNPAISSMEVELSMSIDTSQEVGLVDDEDKKSSPYGNSNPSTPQRASQIFGFLTRGKQSKPAEDLDRSLPEVPSCFSTPSDEHAPGENPHSHLQQSDPPRFQFNPAHFPTMPLAHINDTPRPTRPQSLIEDSPSRRGPRSAFSDDSHDQRFVPKSSFYAHNNVTPGPINIGNPEDNKNAIKVIMNGPTKVIVTAPTPSTNHNGPSRLLRGPRALPRKPSDGGLQRTRSALGEMSNSSSTSPCDPQFMVHPARKRAQTHQRRGSYSSTHSRESREAEPGYISRPKTLERASSGGHRKENQLGLAVKTELPSTPLRSHTTGSRALLRQVVQQSMFHPSVGMAPSPASSSEMSPMGRQMMMDVRQQRMKAREADRQRHGSRYVADRDAQRL